MTVLMLKTDHITSNLTLTLTWIFFHVKLRDYIKTGVIRLLPCHREDGGFVYMYVPVEHGYTVQTASAGLGCGTTLLQDVQVDWGRLETLCPLLMRLILKSVDFRLVMF